MIIRQATASDWPGIWEVVQPVVRAGDTFTWCRQIDEAGAQAIWIKQPPGMTFVADDDGVIVATSEIHPNQGGPGSHVANGGFMVRLDRRGEGIGRALGEHTITEATAAGFDALQFNAVAATNIASIELWLSLGFQILATVPNGFRHPHVGDVGLHIMFRRLTSAG